ncbi:hypothetical protein E1176_07670 [Fulvivirga sp. RKSG066]|uniref:hypothetical protein n=1 Tax=Fulvivirga aurantia TaxID=2529383 RepID=UPI0012BC77EE|nr:hypothetical protein [Fulvivirga aurantia]MTI20895.1 hypothetical protein [Fulvivirga aurantia]
MKYLKKALKLIGFVLLITLASIGLGFNAAILPTTKRQDSNESTIELVESNEEESEIENEEKQ